MNTEGTTAAWVRRGLTVGIACAVGVMAGCGGTRGAKEEDKFFTSGSREADQRASQRMAKEQQLAGGEENRGKPAVAGAPAQVEGRQTLYDRLGGEQGLTAIVDDFTVRVLEDPRVNWERKGVKRGGLFSRDDSPVWTASAQNVARLKKHLVQFLSLASGGPPKYDGREMKNVHAGMRITNPEFDAVIGDLKASLDKLRIPDQEQKELLAVIESTRPQIVTER